MHPRRWLIARTPDVVAAVALLLALPVLWTRPTMFFASWLAAWWFCVGTTLGGLVACWIHALTGGRWGHPIRLVALPLARRLPWLLLLFLPMAAGMTRVFPWAATTQGWTRGIDRPAFELAWYSPAFFWLRMAVIALVWWAISRPAVLMRKGRAAAALMLYAVTGSLAAIDLVMSLVPGWFSTGSGLVNLAGGALGGTALAVLLAARWMPGRFPTPAVVPAKPRVPPIWRDLGNLLLMWTMLWAYLAFVEFLVIWAENLPREIAWFVPRLRAGWAWVGIGLSALQFALPLMCLLSRSNKDDPRTLARIAAGLLAGQLVNTAWLVLPSVVPHGALGWWLVPLLAIAMGLPIVARAVRELEPLRANAATPKAAHA